MKKIISFILMVTFCIGMLGGCAGKMDTAGGGRAEKIDTDFQNAGNVDTTEMEPAVSYGIDTEEAEESMYEYEIRELYAENNGKQIYGIEYVPQNAGGRIPTIIYSHGFGDTHRSGMDYADTLAENGYVVYCFDFCGGGPGSKSDGSMTEMSLFTEQSDLEAVLTMIQEQPYVDRERIVLFGASQGGAVSAVTSAAHKEEIAGLILLYPAFVMADDTRSEFGSVEDIPETYSLMGLTVGREYGAALMDYDFYEVIPQYDKEVLLIHGDKDGIVPISYSEKAAQVYPSVQFEVLSGAGHGFYGKDVEKTIDFILGYLKELFGE